MNFILQLKGQTAWVTAIRHHCGISYPDGNDFFLDLRSNSDHSLEWKLVFLFYK
jgi:hypothetical protein